MAKSFLEHAKVTPVFVKEAGVGAAAGTAAADTAKKYVYKGFYPAAGKVGEIAKASGDVIKAAVTAVGGLFILKRLKEKIQNDTRRKALIEDLIMHDPVISQEDRDTVLQYYATIYNTAPTVSLDKHAVKGLLTSFIRFGTVDVQTLKTLADTEKSITQAGSSVMGKMFS